MNIPKDTVEALMTALQPFADLADAPSFLGSTLCFVHVRMADLRCARAVLEHVRRHHPTPQPKGPTDHAPVHPPSKRSHRHG